jgi:hypothetical protein
MYGEVIMNVFIGKQRILGPLLFLIISLVGCGGEDRTTSDDNLKTSRDDAGDTGDSKPDDGKSVIPTSANGVTCKLR